MRGMARRMGDGTITKLGEGRYWARAPLDERGKRKPLGVWPTREEARKRIDVEIAARKVHPPPVPPVPSAPVERMRVIREVRPSSVKGYTIERITFETSPELEREYLERLDTFLENRRRAGEVEAYLKDAYALLAEYNHEPEDGGELDTWIEWVEGQACDYSIEYVRGLIRAEVERRI